MTSKYLDEKHDMHPKSWLSNYRQTSLTYLTKMGLYYTALGIIASYVVYGLQFFIYGYEEPLVPASLIMMIMAGPTEEILFFGIPYAITGNTYVVLGFGIIWSFVHVFNASAIEIGNLSFANLAFTIPHIFFSLRAWKNGKGWFTIPFHSVWNVFVFGIAVFSGEIPFNLYDSEILSGMFDVGLIIFGIILMGIMFPLYRWRIKREEFKKKSKFS